MFSANIIRVSLELLWVVALASAKSLTKDDERIVGGEPASIAELPHQAHMEHLFGSCGATIINKRHILTAAHCLFANIDPEILEILIGSDNLKSGGKRYKAMSYIVHPDYNRTSLHSDVVVIKLEKDIKFSDKAQPIKLADSGYEVLDGADLIASGWGDTQVKPHPKGTVKLRKVTVPKVSDANCKKAYGSENEITAAMFCAGVPGKDSCHGDSGGPIIQKTPSGNLLVGVVSWGLGCGDPKYPGVYAKVSALRKWIDENSKL